MVIRHLKAFDNEITQLSAYHWQSKFPSSFLTHFSPTTPTLSRFNLLAILKMWFLLLLLSVLVNCTVCASLFTKYTAVLAVFLAFRCSSLVPPFFHCLHAFHFSFTELTTSLLLHQDSLCHGHLPCPSTYFTCSCEKSIFDIFPNALHLCRNLLTFHWHCLFKFLLHNSIFQLPFFLLGGIQMGLTGCADTTKSQTSYLCCVTHSSLLITLVSLMFFICALLTRMKSICVWLPPDEEVIGLLYSCERKCW